MKAIVWDGTLKTYKKIQDNFNIRWIIDADKNVAILQFKPFLVNKELYMYIGSKLKNISLNEQIIL